MSINSINNMGTYRAQMDATNAANAANAARNAKDTGNNRSAQAPLAQQPGGDRISVSTDAVLRTEAYKIASSSPDMRQERVNDLKERIASGNYHIDNKRIASKLVQSEVALFRK